MAINPTTVNPNLLQLYTQMTKNEILLHMTLRALTYDGKVRRNIAEICRYMGKKNRQRMRDAEHSLQKRGLLRVRTVGNRDVWYVYDEPIGFLSLAPTDAPVLEKPDVLSNPRPKPRSLLRRIRSALVRTRLDHFELDSGE